jgi:hypothetical protein
MIIYLHKKVVQFLVSYNHIEWFPEVRSSVRHGKANLPSD